MLDSMPTFPPLLSGHPLAADQDPFAHACDAAKRGALEAGDLVWSEGADRQRFALVLEPEVPRGRCGEMLYVAMVAFGDAAGALIPPEVSITYQWPNVVQMNDGRIGFADLSVSGEESEGVPDWMVLGMDIRLMPDAAETDPGEHYEQTTFWDEGCGDITRTALLESVSRHLVNAIHTWSEDGFRPIHEQWLGRLNEDVPLSPESTLKDARFVGVDEEGNGLLSINGETVARSPVEYLGTGREQAVA